jgi:polyphosphate kinase 2 (PPK2 family)
MLEQVDLGKTLDKDEYQRQLAHYQAQLGQAGHQVYAQKRPVVIVYEGWDAAGKGGSIRRLTEALDPRGYIVHSVGAPKGEDKTHHYLWRFWRRLPAKGQIAIFDRSWYGRVMVERIEGFCSQAEWQRAFDEINQFERQLLDFGAVIVKFWIHISPDEQLARFKARQSTRYKAWKLTAEDWRNREKWDLYRQAVQDMLLQTSTPSAPWTIVEGNSKHYARVKVIRTVVETLQRELEPFDITCGPAKKKKKRG